jgi:hypothetical protein
VAFAETAKLSVELSLKDRMTGGLKGATASLGRFETMAGRAGRAAQTAATRTTALGVVAGGFIASQAALGIRSLAELERLTQQTAAAIETTGGVAGQTTASIRALAESLEDLTTVDDKAIQSGENVLLTFTNIGEETFPAATKAAVDLAVAMAEGDAAAADVAATAKLLGKALNDPAKAFGVLRKAGVVLGHETEDLVEDLVAQGKTVEAQNILLAELARRYGKAGEAAGQGFGGDMRRFSDAVEEAQMALATGLLPVIREFTQWVSKSLKDPKTMDAIREGGKELAGFLRSALEAARNIPWGAIAGAMKIAGAGAKILLDAFVSLPPWVQTAVITGWGLNKLTGGFLGDIVGELGKGLIKGVLNTTAAVMNVKAGVVNGLGGGKPGGGIPGVPVAGAGAAAAGAGGLGVAGIVSAVVPAALVAAMLAAPYIFRGRPGTGAQPMDTQAGRLDQTMTGMMQGLIPQWTTLANNAGATSVVPKVEEVTAATNAAAMAAQRADERSGGTLGDIHAATERTYDNLERNRVAIETSRATATAEARKHLSAIATLQRVGEDTGAKITSLQAATGAKLETVRSAAAASAAAIRAKDWSVSVTVPISVSSRISIRDYNTVSASYASVAKVRAV